MYSARCWANRVVGKADSEQTTAMATINCFNFIFCIVWAYQLCFDFLSISKSKVVYALAFRKPFGAFALTLALPVLHLQVKGSVATAK